MYIDQHDTGVISADEFNARVWNECYFIARTGFHTAEPFQRVHELVRFQLHVVTILVILELQVRPMEYTQAVYDHFQSKGEEYNSDGAADVVSRVQTWRVPARSGAPTAQCPLLAHVPCNS